MRYPTKGILLYYSRNFKDEFQGTIMRYTPSTIGIDRTDVMFSNNVHEDPHETWFAWSTFRHSLVLEARE